MRSPVARYDFHKNQGNKIFRGVVGKLAAGDFVLWVKSLFML